MTADEIRSEIKNDILTEFQDQNTATAINLQTCYLAEIAAQLAELNYNLSAAGQVEREKLTAQLKGRVQG